MRTAERWWQGGADRKGKDSNASNGRNFYEKNKKEESIREAQTVFGGFSGTVCIPNETIDESVTEQLLDKEQLILVYCRSGNRSKQASKKLADLGYTNVKEFGGINTWEYEVEN